MEAVVGSPGPTSEGAEKYYFLAVTATCSYIQLTIREWKVQAVVGLY